jgi:hypothetical protein
MLANGALVYPSQGGSYRAEGCMALGSDSGVVNDPLRVPGRTPLYVDLPSTWGSVDGDRMFSPISWEGSLTGDSDI